MQKGKGRKKPNHVTVALPAELIEEIDALVGRFGFRSRGEVVKEAVRKLLEYYRNVKPLTAQKEK